VLLVNAAKGTVVVEGGRPIKKPPRPLKADPTGGIKTIDGSVHISNVKESGLIERKVASARA
jgi:large subunit ribosomal protein L24